MSTFLSKSALLNALRSAAERRRYSGPYPSWKAAIASCPDRYSSTLVNKFRADRHRNSSPSSELAFNSFLLPLIDKITRAQITDFGGATGRLGQSILLLRPDVSYVVVENNTLVDLMANLSNPVFFSTELPPQCDVFFTSGTLQFLDDPLSILKRGFNSARIAVILARNCFCDEDIFRVQHSPLFANGDGPIPAGYKNTWISYPHRTIKERDAMTIAEQSGFKLVAKFPDDSGVLLYKNKVYGNKLVFMRSKN